MIRDEFTEEDGELLVCSFFSLAIWVPDTRSLSELHWVLEEIPRFLASSRNYDLKTVAVRLSYLPVLLFTQAKFNDAQLGLFVRRVVVDLVYSPPGLSDFSREFTTLCADHFRVYVVGYLGRSAENLKWLFSGLVPIAAISALVSPSAQQGRYKEALSRPVKEEDLQALSILQLNSTEDRLQLASLFLKLRDKRDLERLLTLLFSPPPNPTWARWDGTSLVCLAALGYVARDKLEAPKSLQRVPSASSTPPSATTFVGAPSTH